VRAWLCLAAALVLAITTSSAMLRLSQAGVGCAPWPACYAERSAQPDSAPAADWHAGARLVHRVSASAVGLLFLFIVLFGWSDWSAGDRAAGASLLAVSAGLAILGRYTPSPLPAVTLANLLGGFVLLAATAWLLSGRARRAVGDETLRAALVLALVVIVQAAIGGIVSARAAAAACLDGCAVVVPALADLRTFDLWTVNAALADAAPTSAQRQLALQAHIGVGVVLCGVALWATWRMRSIAPYVSAAPLACVAGAAALGLAMLAGPKSLAVSVVHSACAALALGFAAALWRISSRGVSGAAARQSAADPDAGAGVGPQRDGRRTQA
jgi:cytochrome c oxidase assembly protein subunit 15